MRWRGAIARGKAVSPLQHVRLIRTRRQLKTPERLGIAEGPLFTSRLAQDDAVEALARARRTADRELADHIAEAAGNVETPAPANAPVNGHDDRISGFKSRLEGLGNRNAKVDRRSDEGHSPQNPCVPHDLLEYWSDRSLEPTAGQRIYANHFFAKHPNEMLFTAGGLHQVKFTDVPEVAFMGRSNVGKSSLLNALLGSQVARTSARPGKTQTLNAWTAGGMDRTGRKHRLTVLDMPGYGHGSQNQWGQTITKYLDQRKELKCAFVLINASHGLKKNDVALLEELRAAAIPHQIVLSKVDELIWPTKPERAPARLSRSTSEDYLRTPRAKLASVVEQISKRASNGSLPGLPAMKDIVTCSSMAPFPGQAPEPRGTIGISGLRWAVLNVAGLRPQRNVTNEKDLSFS